MTRSPAADHGPVGGEQPGAASAGEAYPPLRVPERQVPIPSSVSEEARSVMALGSLGPPQPFPAVGDLGGWRSFIEERDSATLSILGASDPDAGVTVTEVELGQAKVHVITPGGTACDDRRVYLDIHGGGFIQGGGELCKIMGTRTAAMVGAKVWAVDYRMPPDHPYPASLDDCVEAYVSLLDHYRPEEIVVGGSSAGGNLAAALLLRARDEGLALPAAAVLNTPESDLTESGDSFQTNLGLDPLLRGGSMPVNLLYAAGHDLRDPYLSPLFGDFSRGFPPTILTTGTRDLFLSNTVLMHRALRSAGIRAELHVFEAAGHGGFLGRAPEDRERIGEIRRFVDEHWHAA